MHIGSISLSNLSLLVRLYLYSNSMYFLFGSMNSHLWHLYRYTIQTYEPLPQPKEDISYYQTW